MNYKPVFQFTNNLFFFFFYDIKQDQSDNNLWTSVNPIMLVDSSTSTLWTSLFPVAGYLVSFFIATIIGIPLINANRAEPYQTLHSAASDIDQHCLPINLLEVSRLNWINCCFYFTCRNFFKNQTDSSVVIPTQLKPDKLTRERKNCMNIIILFPFFVCVKVFCYFSISTQCFK